MKVPSANMTSSPYPAVTPEGAEEFIGLCTHAEQGSSKHAHSSLPVSVSMKWAECLSLLYKTLLSDGLASSSLDKFVNLLHQDLWQAWAQNNVKTSFQAMSWRTRHAKRMERCKHFPLLRMRVLQNVGRPCTRCKVCRDLHPLPAGIPSQEHRMCRISPALQAIARTEPTGATNMLHGKDMAGGVPGVGCM